jgi:cytochrome c biogenesis protein CcmG/thiol:disulfide interchange protein DsbE
MGGQSYPTLLDPGIRTAIDYGLYGVPETFFIDQEGRVAYKHIGPVTRSLLIRKLDEILAGQGDAQGEPVS